MKPLCGYGNYFAILAANAIMEARPLHNEGFRLLSIAC
jgi:hypothetical protein